jgi:effector-binding domain-containing protein
MAVEQASYKIIVKEGSFEVRLYDPMIALVSQEKDFNNTSGFNQLFNYINGKNQESRKIAMTAPVINNLDDEQLTIAFVMPKEYRLEELPKPLQPDLRFTQIPERCVATITFSGNINQEIIEKKKHELIEWLKDKQITTIGSFELARYNPPFIPGLFKHNEIIVAVNYTYNS